MKLSWLDSSLLPATAQREEKEGLYAELYPDGQLKHLGLYAAGSCADAWALYLEHGKEKGKAELAHGSGGTADYELYGDGEAERFDAWSDNVPAAPIAYRTWVMHWIEEIAAAHQRRTESRAHAARTRATIERLGKRAVIKSVDDE